MGFGQLGYISKPKLAGGLGLRDPFFLNQILGAKLWWRWIKNPANIWAKLWQRKYTPAVAEYQLITWNDHIEGSLIWNAAWHNHSIIQYNAFW
jgi:hypothetical protein